MSNTIQLRTGGEGKGGGGLHELERGKTTGARENASSVAGLKNYLNFSLTPPGRRFIRVVVLDYVRKMEP